MPPVDPGLGCWHLLCEPSNDPYTGIIAFLTKSSLMEEIRRMARADSELIGLCGAVDADTRKIIL